MKALIAMSGGVDSAVAAYLTQQQGYDCIGCTMKLYLNDDAGVSQAHTCCSLDDVEDARSVAFRLGMPHYVFNFADTFREMVIDRFVAAYESGLTPNPCIDCNRFLKFDRLYHRAKELGCERVVTGHYARTKDGKLLRAADDNKDQTYFLYRISEESLSHALFPIGDLKKPDLKKAAEDFGLDNAYKKESMGVCFVGDVKMEDFLREFIPVEPGPIIDEESGQEIGTHEGSVFYTIGQRHGLYLGGGLPYYVTRKDTEKNIVYVSRNLNAPSLWTNTLTLEDAFFRETPPEQVEVRLRHRAPLISASYKDNILKFHSDIKRPASGQSAVLYDGDLCLGGGIIAD